MKTRIRFNNLVVSAEELSIIERTVRGLSNLAPSDAFIAIDFDKSDLGYIGKINVASSLRSFDETAQSKHLVELMDELSSLIMVHIELWKKNRFMVSVVQEKSVC